MTLTIISGARPNFMKIAPLCRSLDAAREQGADIRYRIVYTGPEDDPNLEPSLYSDLGMRRPDACLGVSGTGQTEVTVGVMQAFERELDAHPAQVVLVVDDFTATMSCAIVAKKRGLRLAHVIAGTRSFDMNMPREVNRTIVDALSDYLFTAGMAANRNLNMEGMIPDYIHYVGNILMDNLRYNRHRFLRPSWFTALGLHAGHYLLLTLNRRRLTESPGLLRPLLEALLRGSGDLPIMAPLHAYAARAVSELALENKRLSHNDGAYAPGDGAYTHDDSAYALGTNSRLHLLPPQSYLHFGWLVEHARGIVTDSGNIAEEATFLDVPCITLNTYAEHPETWRMGTNTLVGEDPARLSAALTRLLSADRPHATLPDRWDGRTADRIVQTLLHEESSARKA